MRPPFNVPKKLSLADVAVRLEEHIQKRSSSAAASGSPTPPPPLPLPSRNAAGTTADGAHEHGWQSLGISAAQPPSAPLTGVAAVAKGSVATLRPMCYYAESEVSPGVFKPDGYGEWLQPGTRRTFMHVRHAPWSRARHFPIGHPARGRCMTKFKDAPRRRLQLETDAHKLAHYSDVFQVGRCLACESQGPRDGLPPHLPCHDVQLARCSGCFALFCNVACQERSDCPHIEDRHVADELRHAGAAAGLGCQCTCCKARGELLAELAANPDEFGPIWLLSE